MVRLQSDCVENILIALLRMKDLSGRLVRVPVEYAFTPEFIEDCGLNRMMELQSKVINI